MNILLDTHILIWAITDDKRLKQKAREYILDSGNNLYYSAASVFEVDIKTKSRHNNLEFTTDEFIEMCNASGYLSAPLKETHISAANHLVWDSDEDVHQDPFDRILLAQAITENMHFMTSDGKNLTFQTKLCYFSLIDLPHSFLRVGISQSLLPLIVLQNSLHHILETTRMNCLNIRILIINTSYLLYFLLHLHHISNHN